MREDRSSLEEDEAPSALLLLVTSVRLRRYTLLELNATAGSMMLLPASLLDVPPVYLVTNVASALRMRDASATVEEAYVEALEEVVTMVMPVTVNVKSKTVRFTPRADAFPIQVPFTVHWLAVPLPPQYWPTARPWYVKSGPLLAEADRATPLMHTASLSATRRPRWHCVPGATSCR